MIYHANPPAQCDICDSKIDGKFYDTVVHYLGRHGWLNCCPTCFKERRGLLGTGLGQEYTRQINGQYLKTAG